MFSITYTIQIKNDKALDGAPKKENKEIVPERTACEKEFQARDVLHKPVLR